MPIVSDSIVVIGALAIFVERFLESVINAVLPDPKEGEHPSGIKKIFLTYKRLLAVMLTASAGLIIAFALDLHLMAHIIPESGLSTTQDKMITGLLIGGGSAPAHEVLRYIEEKKKKAEAEKEDKQLDVKSKQGADAKPAN